MEPSGAGGTLLQGSLEQTLQPKLLCEKSCDASAAVWFQLACWLGVTHPLGVLSDMTLINVG